MSYFLHCFPQSLTLLVFLVLFEVNSVKAYWIISLGTYFLFVSYGMHIPQLLSSWCLFQDATKCIRGGVAAQDQVPVATEGVHGLRHRPRSRLLLLPLLLLAEKHRCVCRALLLHISVSALSHIPHPHPRTRTRHMSTMTHTHT